MSTPEEKIALITEGLQEVLGKSILEDVIIKQNRPLKVYWGKQTCALKLEMPKWLQLAIGTYI